MKMKNYRNNNNISSKIKEKTIKEKTMKEK